MTDEEIEAVISDVTAIEEEGYSEGENQTDVINPVKRLMLCSSMSIIKHRTE